MGVPRKTCEDIFKSLRMEKYLPLFQQEEMEAEDILLFPPHRQREFIPKAGPLTRLIDYLVDECGDDYRVQKYVDRVGLNCDEETGDEKTAETKENCTENSASEKLNLNQKLSYSIRNNFVYKQDETSESDIEKTADSEESNNLLPLATREITDFLNEKTTEKAEKIDDSAQVPPQTDQKSAKTSKSAKNSHIVDFSLLNRKKPTPSAKIEKAKKTAIIENFNNSEIRSISLDIPEWKGETSIDEKSAFPLGSAKKQSENAIFTDKTAKNRQKHTENDTESGQEILENAIFIENDTESSKTLSADESVEISDSQFPSESPVKTGRNGHLNFQNDSSTPDYRPQRIYAADYQKPRLDDAEALRILAIYFGRFSPDRSGALGSDFALEKTPIGAENAEKAEKEGETKGETKGEKKDEKKCKKIAPENAPEEDSEKRPAEFTGEVIFYRMEKHFGFARVVPWGEGAPEGCDALLRRDSLLFEEGKIKSGARLRFNLRVETIGKADARPGARELDQRVVRKADLGRLGEYLESVRVEGDVKESEGGEKSPKNPDSDTPKAEAKNKKSSQKAPAKSQKAKPARTSLFAVNVYLQETSDEDFIEGQVSWLRNDIGEIKADGDRSFFFRLSSFSQLDGPLVALGAKVTFLQSLRAQDSFKRPEAVNARLVERKQLLKEKRKVDRIKKEQENFVNWAFASTHVAKK